MAVCLDKIVDFNGNTYGITNAIIKRAKQITEIGDEDLLRHNGKVVSTSIEQVYTKKISYHLIE